MARGPLRVRDGGDRQREEKGREFHRGWDAASDYLNPRPLQELEGWDGWTKRGHTLGALFGRVSREDIDEIFDWCHRVSQKRRPPESPN